MAVSIIGPKMYCWDRDGKPLAFGKVYTYKARTNAPKVTYTTEDSITANSNPVILNGEGYADIYLTGSYKVVVKDKDGNEIWTADPVSEAAGVGFSYIVTAYYASSSSFNILGDHLDAFAIGARVELSFLDALNTETTVTASSFDGTNTLVEVFDTVVRTSITSAGISTGFSSLADFAELSSAQLEEQEEEFQNRFAVVRPAINWTASTLIDNPLQLYSTGTEGVSGYQQWLPDPSQLPFTTENTFPEDQSLSRWTESNTASVDYVEESIHLNKESFDSLTSAIAFVTANPDTIERLSTASRRDEAECAGLGINYPDGGGADYVIEALGAPDGYGDHAAGTKQLTLSKAKINIKQYGAIPDGVTDSLANLNAAGSVGAEVEVVIPKGNWLLSSPPTPTANRVTWVIDRGAEFVNTQSLTPSNTQKIVSLGDYKGITSDPSFHGGIFGYLENNSAITGYGNLGVHGNVHTSWRGAGESGADIGVSAFAAQDKVGNLKGAWAFYGTTVREPDVDAAAFCMEVDIANMGSTKPLFPHTMFSAGQTQALWLGSGGEITEVPETVGTASCAIGILSNDPALNADFEKGIVFHSEALSGTDGLTGIGIAIAMSTRQSSAWYDQNNTKVGEITSTNTGDSANAQRLDFNQFGLTVTDLNDAGIQFQVRPVDNATSHIALGPSTTDTPSVIAAGASADIDLELMPKGSGRVKLGYGSSPADVPGNFSASGILEIKDATGTSLYIPISSTQW